MEQSKLDSVATKTFQVITVLLGTALALFIAYQLRTIISWVVLGAFLAVIINPAVSRLAKRMPKKKRGLALTLVLITLGLGLVGFTILFITPLIKQTALLVQEWPTIIANFTERLSNSSSSIVQFLDQHGLTQYVESQKAAFSSAFSNLLIASFDKVFAFVNNMIAGFTILVIAIYMSLNGPQYFRTFVSRMPANKKEDTKKLISSMYRAVTGYINGNLLTSFIAGTTAGLTITALGIPYAAVLGLIVAITDLVPLIGAQLGALTVIITAYFQSPTKAIIMAIFFVIYQSFENYVLSPKIMSRTVAISPILVFLFVLCGATLAGFIGALIAIPVGACSMILGNYLLKGTVWEKD